MKTSFAFCFVSIICFTRSSRFHKYSIIDDSSLMMSYFDNLIHFSIAEIDIVSIEFNTFCQKSSSSTQGAFSSTSKFEDWIYSPGCIEFFFKISSISISLMFSLFLSNSAYAPNLSKFSISSVEGLFLFSTYSSVWWKAPLLNTACSIPNFFETQSNITSS